MQVTIVLDSGTFLDNANSSEYEIGYFRPVFVIHGDGEELMTIDVRGLPPGCKELRFRHFDAKGVEQVSGVTASKCLVKGILRLSDLYGRNVLVNSKAFDSIFRFNSGLFCCSKPKVREFKEVDKTSKVAGKGRKKIGPIPHDVLIMYELNEGDTLKLFCDQKEVWSTSSHPGVLRRFDIDVVADHATSEQYYCDVVILNQGENYYHVPNQGDPPPDSMGGRP